MYHRNPGVKIVKKDWNLVSGLFHILLKERTKKSPLIKGDFYFLYHTCPQMLDNLTNWKIAINQDT